MNHESSALPNADSQRSKQSAINLGDEGVARGMQIHEHSKRNESHSRSSRSRSGRTTKGYNPKRPKGWAKLSYFEKTQIVLIAGCCLLGLFVFSIVGFYFGRKSVSDAMDKVVIQASVLPTRDADGFLDDAFKSYQEGKYREAMLNFQKVANVQPALVGIDYLIADASLKAGEAVLAENAANKAISKNEFAQEAQVLVALINLSKTKTTGPESQQLVDPNTSTQEAIKQLMATHLGDPKAYLLLAEFLRSNGAYRSAVDMLQKGLLRTNPDFTRAVLSAKKELTLLQDKPQKKSPSLSELTSMSAEQALLAAFTSLQLNQNEEAASFLKRAQEQYSPEVFKDLMDDVAFVDFRNTPEVKAFFYTTIPANP